MRFVSNWPCVSGAAKQNRIANKRSAAFIRTPRVDSEQGGQRVFSARANKLRQQDAN